MASTFSTQMLQKRENLPSLLMNTACEGQEILKMPKKLTKDQIGMVNLKRIWPSSKRPVS